MGGRGGASHLAVRTGTVIPLSLQMFAGKEARDIQRLIRTAHLTPADVAYLQSQLTKIIAANDLAMRVDSEIIEPILDSHFKNQMETHTSNGANMPDIRAKLSADYFGHSYNSVSKATPDVFEKYGYLAPRDKVAAMSARADWYGDVVVRFNRDAVMDRTTFKTDDTLNTWANGSNAHAGSLKTASISGINDLNSDTIRRVKAAESLITNPDKWVSAVNMGSYFELQYHGHLSFDDVESVTFGDTLPNNFNRILGKLKKKGVKVYRVTGGTLSEL